jgi:dipeptidyl aminopeptidase/acylaminoacyl peptidase
VWILFACVALIGCTPRSAPVAFNAAARQAGEQVRIPSDGLMLRGWLLKPTGSGPFPAIVYNHGSVRDPSIDYFGDLAMWFQAHGCVVLLPFRRGAGGSDGPYWDDVVPQDGEARDRTVVAQLERENDDVVNAIAWLRAKPYVDSARVIVAGCSFGAFIPCSPPSAR